MWFREYREYITKAKILNPQSSIFPIMVTIARSYSFPIPSTRRLRFASFGRNIIYGWRKLHITHHKNTYHIIHHTSHITYQISQITFPWVIDVTIFFFSQQHEKIPKKSKLNNYIWIIFVSVLLSALVKRFSVSRMRNFDM